MTLALSLPAAARDVSAGFSLQEVRRLVLDDAEAGADGEREVLLYLRALAEQGDPVDDLIPPHLDIRLDGERVDPDDVSVDHLGRTGQGVTWVLAIDASRSLGEAFEDSRDDARIRLEALSLAEAGSRSLLHDSVHAALELLRRRVERPRRAALLLFSDGGDSGSDHSLEQVAKRARDDRVLIYTLGYGRFGTAGLADLETLARETGAEHHEVSSAGDLPGSFDRVRERMARSYVVRFPAAMDGESHEIEVSVDGQSDRIALRHPRMRGPFWPWLVGLAALALAGAVTVALGARGAGRLVFVDGPREGEVQPLRRGRLRIGAIDGNEIVIPSLSVSRHHAELFVHATRVEIKDLHSSNGTRINGQKVAASPLVLHPGDRIQIADVELVYER